MKFFVSKKKSSPAPSYKPALSKETINQTHTRAMQSNPGNPSPNMDPSTSIPPFGTHGERGKKKTKNGKKKKRLVGHSARRCILKKM
jgi:hypothetical protein